MGMSVEYGFHYKLKGQNNDNKLGAECLNWAGNCDHRGTGYGNWAPNVELKTIKWPKLYTWQNVLFLEKEEFCFNKQDTRFSCCFSYNMLTYKSAILCHSSTPSFRKFLMTLSVFLAADTEIYKF